MVDDEQARPGGGSKGPKLATQPIRLLLAELHCVSGKRGSIVHQYRCSASHVVLVWVALLVSACGVFATPTPVKEPLDLTIVHTGKVYGEILPCG